MERSSPVDIELDTGPTELDHEEKKLVANFPKPTADSSAGIIDFADVYNYRLPDAGIAFAGSHFREATMSSGFREPSARHDDSQTGRIHHKSTSSTSSTVDTEVIVQRINFAIELQIERLLVKHHDNLISRICELLSLRSDDFNIGRNSQKLEVIAGKAQMSMPQKRESLNVGRDSAVVMAELEDDSDVARALEARKIYALPTGSKFDMEAQKSSSSTNSGKKGESSEFVSVRRREGRQALHPDSKFKLYWDVLSVFLVCYDLVTVPIFFAWQLRSPFVFASSIAISVFWSLDIPVSFNTGYHTADVDVERRPAKAAVKYMKGWFTMDFFLAVVDWVTFILSSNTYQQIARILKLMVRVPSKVPRMLELYASLLLRLKSQYTHFFLDLGRLIFVLIFFNHLLACLWFFIGCNPVLCEPACDETWMKTPQMSYRSTSYEYLTALHWALTQMTPASMEVVPENAGERLINICIIILGMLLSASIVSTMTSIMTQIRVRSDAKMQANMQLQRFLKQEKVNDELRMQVLRQVTWRLRQSKRLTTSEVSYIKMTSRSLQEQLNYVVYCPKLYGHNLFASIDNLNKAAMRQFCSIVRILAFAKEDAMFEKDAVGSGMYFITYGQACYNPGPDAVEYDNDEAKVTVDPLEWCSEPAMWLEPWIHLGDCIYTSQSEVLAPNANDLVAAIKSSTNVHCILESYSKIFQDYCNRSMEISDLSKLYDPVELFYGLEHKYRHAITSRIIDNMQKLANKTHRKKLEVLREEVRLGKCSLSFVQGHGVMRIVYLAALRITLKTAKEDKTSFPRQATPDSSTTSAAVALPRPAEEPDSSPTSANSLSKGKSASKSGLLKHVSNVTECLNSGTIFFSEDDETLVLCEVAEFSKKKGKFEAKCNLPGTKRREQESAAAATRRLLTKDLKELISARVKVNVKTSVDNSFTKKSPTYGLNTKYVKSYFNAVLNNHNALSLPRVRSSVAHWTAEHRCREAATKAAAEVKLSMHSCFRSEDDDGWSEMAQEVESLLKQDRDVISLAGGHRLYLWLTPAEMDLLSHEDAAIPLEEWVKGFSHPSDEEA